MGVGATKRLSAVRWGVASSILIAGSLTFPAAGGVAALVYFLLQFRLPAALIGCGVASTGLGLDLGPGRGCGRGLEDGPGSGRFLDMPMSP